MGQVVLSVNGLQKRVRRRLIIKDVSFTVESGQIYGFLGPNGAGKTTTIRMLVGLIRPTAGTIQINGYDLRREPLRAMQGIGCIVENPDLYPYLTGYENLLQLARMQGPVAVNRIEHVARLVHLSDRLNDKVGTYSLGMRQRLGIAQALLGDPKLLILDEPTNGLDPAGIRELRNFLRDLAGQGMSIFISSHLLAEIELLCDHVAIIHDGTVVRTGEIQALLAEAASEVEWRVKPIESALHILRRFAEHGQVTFNEIGVERRTRGENVNSPGHPNSLRDSNSSEHPNLSGAPYLGDKPVTLRCSMADNQVAIAAAELAAAGCQIFEITRRKPTLEEIFLQTTGSESAT